MPAIPIGELSLPELRRVAQVAFDCPETYIVMSARAPDYEVAGAVDTLDEAEKLLGSVGGAPFRIIQINVGSQVHDIFDPSIHTCWTEWVRPPGGRPRINIDDIRRVRVILEWDGGTHEFSATGPVDAIALSRRARERFAYPYYQATFGTAHVNRIRERFGD